MNSDWLVMDASIAIKAILPNPEQENCLALVGTLAQIKPLAPALWAYETTSALNKAVHFKSITQDEARQALKLLQTLEVQLFVPDEDQNLKAFEWTLRIRRASAYDSYYLTLAQTLDCEFWTADKRLYNALKDEQLEWLHYIGELNH
jgi:predicted nucleic acid-binding protein